MLVYHPAFDFYHSLVRSLALLQHFHEPLHVDRLRILNFYAAFPPELANARLPAGSGKVRARARRKESQYNIPHDRLVAFRRSSRVLMSALNSLSATQIVKPERLAHDLCQLNNAKLQWYQEVNEAVSEYADREAELLEDINTTLGKVHLLGPGGVKHRSGLMEHRYDVQ